MMRGVTDLLEHRCLESLHTDLLKILAHVPQETPYKKSSHMTQRGTLSSAQQVEPLLWQGNSKSVLAAEFSNATTILLYGLYGIADAHPVGLL